MIRATNIGIYLGLLIVAIGTPKQLPAQCRTDDKQAATRAPTVCIRGGWHVAETSGFWVCCYNRDLPIAKIAEQCEALHRQLRAKWLAEDPPAEWSPKCVVVLHPTQQSYLAAVGRDAANTAGSSLVETEANRVSKRRIDLRVDRPDYLTAALPHELTHVILADHFSRQSLPRWADEGMAILADTKAKRELHARDLQAARAKGTTIALTKLLSEPGYPPAYRWDAFYGQSVSVVDYLVGRGTPHKFVQFLDAARGEGYDRALRRFYGIRDAQGLDRLWTASLDKPAVNLAANP